MYNRNKRENKKSEEKRTRSFFTHQLGGSTRDDDLKIITKNKRRRDGEQRSRAKKGRRSEEGNVEKRTESMGHVRTRGREVAESCLCLTRPWSLGGLCRHQLSTARR